MLEATVGLIAEAGYGAVTIEAVAARSGVAKSTIYRHWPSRLELINDAFHELKPAVPMPTEGTVRERLIAFLEHVARNVGTSTWSACLPALIDAAEHDPDARALHCRLTEAGRQSLVDLLEEGVGNGELPAGLDLELLAEALFGPDPHPPPDAPRTPRPRPGPPPRRSGRPLRTGTDPGHRLSLAAPAVRPPRGRRPAGPARLLVLSCPDTRPEGARDGRSLRRHRVGGRPVRHHRRAAGPLGRGAAGARPVRRQHVGRDRRPGPDRPQRPADRDVARGLPVRPADVAQRVRGQQAAAADRAAEGPGVAAGDRPEARRPLRGPRRGRQGRDDQAVHRAPQPPRDLRGGADGARASASAGSGTSSATCSTCRRGARSCCSTARGTTGPASSG